jgi:diguanylate cyclase (GGDEF)-like protein/PAS domain S-box-containing protein
MIADLGRADENLYRVAVDASPCATLLADASGTVALANREAERLFACQPGMIVGRPIESLLPEDQPAEPAAGPLARSLGHAGDGVARRGDGTVFPVQVGVTPIRTPQGVFRVYAVVDLTARKRVEERLSQQAAALAAANARLTELATTDSLTALWNRRAFLEQLDIQLEQSVRTARPLSVLILDVDDFKPYNDQYGHLAGDEILRGAARLMRERARRSDFIARIGGEEFGVILHEADRQGAVRLAENLRTAVEAATWPRRRITVSVGAATVRFPGAVPRPTSPPRSEVLSLADRALYFSKEHGRNRVTHVEDLTVH